MVNICFFYGRSMDNLWYSIITVIIDNLWYPMVNDLHYCPKPFPESQATQVSHVVHEPDPSLGKPVAGYDACGEWLVSRGDACWLKLGMFLSMYERWKEREREISRLFLSKC